MLQAPKNPVSRCLGILISHIRPSSISRPCTLYRNVGFSAYSMWLFTYSDIKTIIVPKTVFGVLSAISSSVFELPAPPLFRTIIRMPTVALWCWINLLPFAIDNQRQPSAIIEDSINKPWRPLPAARISPKAAKSLVLSLYPVTLITSSYLGGMKQSLTLVLLGIWYNDFQGSDTSCLVRNLINGAGFVSYTSGAMEVAYGSPITLTTSLGRWQAILGIVVASTVHTQDMYDQAGDSARGRKTVPLVLSDGSARWTIAVALIFWSWACSIIWRADWGCVAPVGLGHIIAWRILVKRSVEEDKVTFRLWNLWMVALYALPSLQMFLNNL